MHQIVCSKLNKSDCNTKDGCVWIVGTGCKRKAQQESVTKKPGCSRLNKTKCNSLKEDCTWVIGKGCTKMFLTPKKTPQNTKRTKSVCSKLNRAECLENDTSFPKISIKVAKNDKSLLEAITIYNSIDLNKKTMTLKEMHAVNTVLDSVQRIHPEIKRRFIMKSEYVISNTVPLSPSDKFLRNNFNDKDFTKYTKKQIVNVMLRLYNEYKKRLIPRQDRMEEDTPTIPYDIYTALFDDWSSWGDTSIREQVYMRLASRLGVS